MNFNINLILNRSIWATDDDGEFEKDILDKFANIDTL